VFKTRLPVGALAVTPSQKILAAGCGDYSGSLYASGQIWLFDRDSGDLKSWMISGGPIWDLAFSPDGKLLAAGDDSGLTVWDVEKYQP
jgi:WD40 repeat protein